MPSNMEELLRQFYNNKPEQEAVKFFIQDKIKEIALDKLFKGENASGAADAKKAVDEAFSKLREMFEPIKRNNKKSSI